MTTLQDAYDADADGSDAVITTNATDGAVVIAGDQNFVYSATGNLIVDTNTLFVDTTNDRIGIGDATPSAALTVGAGDLFQVTSSGVIAAATGLTTSGNVDLTAATMLGGTPMVFEGATADVSETSLSITDPTADRTITLQDGSGVLAFTSDIVLTLAGLTDTNITSPLSGDLLLFDGADWLNRAMSGAATISSTGVLTLSADSVGATQLASSGATAGTYGSATQVPVITIDADGRVTSASTVAASGGSSHFGGDGSDGALSISSGTTTIDLQSKRFVVLNYTSVSITGTGKLAFSNPSPQGSVVVMRVQGDATITSTAPGIDLTNTGGQGGNGATAYCDGRMFARGGAGKGPSSGQGGGWEGPDCLNPQPPPVLVLGGGGTSLYSNELWGSHLRPAASSQEVQRSRTTDVFPGSGGAGGTASSLDFDGGNGGSGAGGMFLEVGGTYTFAGSIDASGSDGLNAEDQGSGNAGGGGGAGGSGGHLLVIYETLGSDSGTYLLDGGLGGNGTAGSSGDGGPGGGGAGAVLNAGSNGTAPSGSTGGDGGDGADGTAVRMLNTVF